MARSLALVILAIVVVPACGKREEAGPPPAPVESPKIVKKPVPTTPLPPLAADQGGATGKPVWAVALGGFGTTAPKGIAVDADGNVYVCGYFDGEVDFGDGAKLGKRKSAGGIDAFVAKLDPKGQLLWVQTFGGERRDSANAIAVRGESVVVVGSFTDELRLVDWNGRSEWNHKGQGTDDSFVAAFDRDGTPKWLWTLGGVDSDGMNAIAAMPDGGWVIGGSYRRAIKVEQLDIKLEAKGGTDAVLARLAAGGDVEWIKSFGGKYDDEISHLAVDPRGSIYVQGVFKDIADWGGKPLKAGGGSDFDVVLAKYDVNGDHVWSQRFGNAFNDVAGGVVVDRAGNVTMTGSFDKNMSFGAGDNHVSLGESDIFVTRFTTDGKLEWARTFGSEREDVGWGIAADAAGNTVTTGWFQRSVDFGTGVVTSKGEKDVFALKLDPKGAIAWVKTWGDHDYDQGRGVAIDAAGNALVTGIFRFTLALPELKPLESKRPESDPLLSKAPHPNAFVIRLDR